MGECGARGRREGRRLPESPEGDKEPPGVPSWPAIHCSVTQPRGRGVHKKLHRVRRSVGGTKVGQKQKELICVLMGVCVTGEVGGRQISSKRRDGHVRGSGSRSARWAHPGSVCAPGDQLLCYHRPKEGPSPDSAGPRGSAPSGRVTATPRVCSEGPVKD